jgi:hypothetical protein
VGWDRWTSYMQVGKYKIEGNLIIGRLIGLGQRTDNTVVFIKV